MPLRRGASPPTTRCVTAGPFAGVRSRNGDPRAPPLRTTREFADERSALPLHLLEQPERVGVPYVKREDPRFDLDEARDQAWMSKIRAGDQEAFRELFHKYAPTAMALARRVLRRQTLAEETVQEAFLSVWKAPDRFDPGRGSLRAWLMSMVHHRAIDLVRREEAQQRRSLESVTDASAEDDPGIGVVEEVTLAQARLEVRRALDALPAAQRQVVELMYFGGYSQTQIAESMDIPLGTVKSRAMLGMRRLRGALLGIER